MDAKTSNHTPLGGRLPLILPSESDSEQKRLHARPGEKILPWAKEAGFQAVDARCCVIGPFNPMLRSPATSQASLDLVEAKQRHTALNKKVREVVILTVGAIWQGAYELYAHSAVGLEGGGG